MMVLALVSPLEILPHETDVHTTRIIGNVEYIEYGFLVK